MDKTGVETTPIEGEEVLSTTSDNESHLPVQAEDEIPFIDETSGVNTETEGKNDPDDAEPQEPEQDPRDIAIAQLRAELEEIKAASKPKADIKKEDEVPSINPLSDEHFPNTEKDFGFIRTRQKDENTGEERETLAIDSKKLISTVLNLAREAIVRSREYTDETVHGNVYDIRFESLLSDMRKDTPDIHQYSDSIKKELAEMFRPEDRTKKENIMRAYHISKGKNMKNIVNSVKKNNEVQKTVIRPVSGSGNPQPKSNQRLTPAGMTSEQKKLAEGLYPGLPPAKAWESYARDY